MVLSALLLVTLATAACAIGVRLTLRRLGLRFMDTLLYLGLAEVPPPKAGRRAIERDRAAASRAPLRIAS